MAGLSRFWWPETSRRLLVGEGEFIRAEVTKHWITRVVPVLGIVAGMAAFATMPLVPPVWGVPAATGWALGAWGFYRLHGEFMDRFVVTNMRVFRVHGIFDQHMATMPIARILDISVRQTVLGQVLGYGHFVFESAAQEQGLREIRFVPRVEEYHMLIEQTIQRAGLRARMEMPDDFDGV